MTDSFQLFRLALLPREQGALFDENPDRIDREAWLRRLLGEPQTFIHRGNYFHYQPFEAAPDASVMVGKLGRRIARAENRPPNEGLEEYTHEGWRAALVVIDPTDHEDGQKLAIQRIQDVGKPEALARSLVRILNARFDNPPYSLEAGPILATDSFWDFVDKNRGTVTSVRFEFIAPNIFGGDDAFKAEMEQFRDSEKVRRLQLGLSNPDGLNLETERVRRAVDYAGRRGGSIRARAKGKKSYNSKRSHKVTTLEDDQGGEMGLVERARAFAQRILGRE